MMTIETTRNLFNNDPAAIREALKKWRNAMVKLDDIVGDDVANGETPEHSVKTFVAECGYDVAVFVIASLVNQCSWDGRIFPAVKEWAESVESLDSEAANHWRIYARMHKAHLNQIAEAMMKYVPEIPAEDIEEAFKEWAVEEVAAEIEAAQNEEEEQNMNTNTITETAQQKTDRENWEHCKSIALDLDRIAEGSAYRCPHCGEIIFWNNDQYNDDEAVYTCPECGETFDECDLEPFSIYDYFSDCLDIEYRIGYDKQFRSVRIMVACGGPNIYIDTASGNVELYWWADRASYALASGTIDAINAEFEEIYDCC